VTSVPLSFPTTRTMFAGTPIDRQCGDEQDGFSSLSADFFLSMSPTDDVVCVHVVVRHVAEIIGDVSEIA